MSEKAKMKRIWVDEETYNKLHERAKEEGFKTVDEYVVSVMEDIFHALSIPSK
jgi:tetrahydromethanopterin S-methyltransferase subunit G